MVGASVVVGGGAIVVVVVVGGTVVVVVVTGAATVVVDVGGATASEDPPHPASIMAEPMLRHTNDTRRHAIRPPPHMLSCCRHCTLTAVRRRGRFGEAGTG
nr:hypothetical protein GCM10017611_43680 [Rhodococcus wratislaviensis]